MSERDKVQRIMRTAKTWIRKGTSTAAFSEDVLDFESLEFLVALLDAADDLVGHRPPTAFYESEGGNFYGLDLGPAGTHLDPDFEHAEKLAGRILDRLKKQRERGEREQLIAKLENVEGRTPEEAELYLSRARALRAAHGG